MKCPFCGQLDNKVIDSRLSRDNMAIRRRRECLVCDRRFTTYEKIEEHIPMLIKKDGRREPYSRVKLTKGITTATQKRPVPMAEIEHFIDQLERQLQETGYNEVKTSELGEKVSDFLRTTDDVAYVRFTSVYKRFKNLEDFDREIRQLDGDKSAKVEPLPAEKNEKRK
ncbi:MAG: transcriptional regulator NrdR [Deltaproteobacteria bacterium]|jgi:transcriptional repressor NrdR|nr:transcriptional regulator NrdR [Deltaproteobacteria bacterium]